MEALRISILLGKSEQGNANPRQVKAKLFLFTFVSDIAYNVYKSDVNVRE